MPTRSVGQQSGWVSASLVVGASRWGGPCPSPCLLSLQSQASSGCPQGPQRVRGQLHAPRLPGPPHTVSLHSVGQSKSQVTLDGGGGGRGRPHLLKAGAARPVEGSSNDGDRLCPSSPVWQGVGEPREDSRGQWGLCHQSWLVGDWFQRFTAVTSTQRACYVPGTGTRRLRGWVPLLEG